jgi:hypothetical protein
MSGASVDTGRTFWGGSSGGRWATERMVAAMKAGRQMSTKELRGLDTLRKDEWKSFDNVLVREAQIRLRAVADLYAAGLTKPISGGLGKTMHEYEKMTDMTPAIMSMDGNVRSDNDRVDFELDGIPLPIIHKDFDIQLRTLQASRNGGDPLDTIQIEQCGRRIAEKLEDLLINGTSKLYGGRAIYGYTTFPGRIEESFGAGGSWDQTAKTGDQIIDDILTMKASLHSNRRFGPYWLYVPGDADVRLDLDFKADGTVTRRGRILQIEGITKITTLDTLASGNVVMIQPTRETVELLTAVPLQNIQWDMNGGFTIAFKSFTVQIPLLRTDAAGRSGIVHMHT